MADREFIPIGVAVLTASDSRTSADDTSGDYIADRLDEVGHTIVARAIVADSEGTIRTQLRAWIADPEIDVIIATGGTGVTPRDVTPEAVEPLFEKKMDAFSALFLVVSFQKIGTSAVQSRATAGVAGALTFEPRSSLSPTNMSSRPPPMGESPCPRHGRNDKTATLSPQG